jgi:hypothetical protein
MQGGATAQFAAVPMNLAAAGDSADYVNTGHWSGRAILEARRFVDVGIAADESRIRQAPIVWEADLTGYRFVTEINGERRLITDDDLLRERAWERPLSRLAVYEAATGDTASQVVLGPGAPPVRVPIVREWVQPRWRLEISNDIAQASVAFDESGRSNVALR